MREGHGSSVSYVVFRDLEVHGHRLILGDTNEVVEFFWYVVVYCDRWCGGQYEEYTNNGLIGELLVRLQELPHTVCLDDIASSNPQS